MCREFVNESQSDSCRQLVGIYIKNLIVAQDENLLKEKQGRWIACPDNVKEEIRNGFIFALQCSNSIVAHTAAQIIAAFGGVDIPRGQWPNLVPTLLQLSVTVGLPIHVKKSSLEAIGYLCDELPADMVDTQMTNQMLNAIIEGMGASHPDDIRLAASVALNNSLEFADANFSQENERNAIMSSILTITQAATANLRASAYECLSTCTYLHYSFMLAYMDSIFNVTTVAITTDVELVAKQALEVWFNICDTELDILEDEDSELTNLNIIKSALPRLLPIVLETMTKQADDTDDDDVDELTLAQSGQALLHHIGETVSDDIIPLLLPFITSNVTSDNWRLKDAAIYALGAMLAGVSPASVAAIIPQALPVVVPGLRHTSNTVKYSTMWMLGNLLEFHCDSIPAAMLQQTIHEIMASLDDPSAKIVAEGCEVIRLLGESQAKHSDTPTNVLSSNLNALLQKLFQISNRSDWDSHNLRISAYEASTILISSSACDMQQLVSQVLQECMNRIEVTFNVNQTVNASTEERYNLQTHLCTLIAACVSRLDVANVTTFCDRLIQLLLVVVVNTHGNAQAEALLAVACIVNKLESLFIRYIPHIVPVAITSIGILDQYAVVTAATVLFTDMYRLLGKEMMPYSDDIMNCIIVLLKSETVKRESKPTAIGLIADMANALEHHFQPYMHSTMQMLGFAGHVTCSSSDDEDMIEFVNALRASILEAYTAICLGLGKTHRQLLSPYMSQLLSLIQLNFQCEHDKTEDLCRGLVGIIGDLCQIFEKSDEQLVSFCNTHRNDILQLFQEYQEYSTSDDNDHDKLIGWVKGNLRSVLN